MFLAAGVQDRRRQRRDGQREAESEHQHARQYGGRIGARLVDDAEKHQAEAGHDRPQAHRQPRPDALRQASGTCGQEQHHDRQRHEGRASTER